MSKTASRTTDAPREAVNGVNDATAELKRAAHDATDEAAGRLDDDPRTTELSTR